MATEKDAYAVLGELSAKFSNLEFAVSNVLEMLIDSTAPAVGAVLTSNQSLSKNFDLISKLVSFRFAADSEVAAEVSTMVAEANNLRRERNLFVHGNWLISPEGVKADTIICYDLRPKLRQNGYSLTRFEEHKFTIEELRGRSEEVGELVAQSFRLARELGATGLNIKS